MIPKTNKKIPNRSWWRYFSMIFALILLLLVLRNISIEEVLNSLATVDIGLLLIAFLFNFTVVILMALRWYILYNIIPNSPTFIRLIKVTIVSVFFNTILPSVVGGDTYRTLNLSKGDNNESSIERSFSVVFVDRSIGLIALMMLGCFGLVFNSIIVIPPIVSILTITLLFGFIIILILSMSQRVYQLLANCFSWLPDPYFQRINTLFLKIQSNISVFRNHVNLLIVGLLISFIQRFCWLMGAYYVGMSLNLGLSLLTFILFLPVIEIIRLIPLTIQGIGVREGLFIVFFGTVGISDSNAVLLATIIYLIPSIIGMIGGGIYLFEQLQNMRSEQNESVD